MLAQVAVAHKTPEALMPARAGISRSDLLLRAIR
jgi:hypothetical protein